MDLKEITLRLSQAVGVSGAEGQAAPLARELLSPFGEVSVTPLGSVVCTVQAPKEGQPHMLWDAHLDEIGMMVTYIDDQGFLKVANTGGINRQLLMASSVTVHTEKGPVKGVVCSVPPHLQKGDKRKVPSMEEVYLDIGFDGQQAREHVSVGDVVTIDSTSRVLSGDLLTGKAMDDRACCACLIRALELLKGRELPCGLTVQLSTMEEIGGMGATTAAYQVNPTHAIAVDVSHAKSPGVPEDRCGILGEGPMIGFAPILSKTVCRELVKTAQEEQIPYQLEAMGRSTGTNADNIALRRGGISMGLVSLPLKYMHTPVEVVSLQDMENTARLLASHLLQAFSTGTTCE